MVVARGQLDTRSTRQTLQITPRLECGFHFSGEVEMLVTAVEDLDRLSSQSFYSQLSQFDSKPSARFCNFHGVYFPSERGKLCGRREFQMLVSLN